MFKNIVKSICWFVLYFVLQTIGMVGMFFIDLFAGNLPFTDLENMEVFMEELTVYLLDIAVPSLFIAAIFFILIFVIYKKVRKHSFDYKTIDGKKLLFFLCVGFLLNIVITLIINLVALVVPESWVEAMNASTEAALSGQSFIVLLLSTGIFAPLLEELVFRYGICGTLARKNTIFALIASALVFGIVHGNIIQGAYAALLGLIFGIIYLKYKNIWYPAIMHMAINSSSVIVTYTESAWLYAVFAVLAIGGIVILVKKYPDLKDIFKKENAYLEENKDNI